jgi:hypothetical protein
MGVEQGRTHSIVREHILLLAPYLPLGIGVYSKRTHSTTS